MRKIKVILTAMLLAVAVASCLAFAACNKGPVEQETPKGPAVTLDKETVSVKVGETVTVVATVRDEGKTVVWLSDDETIATVAAGVISGVSAGNTTVSAKVDDETVSCVVTVTQDPAVAMTKDGKLSFTAMSGEKTIEVYEGDNKVDTKTTAEQSFDAYSAIIDYREANSVTENAAYSVKVTFGDFSETFETATFAAIGDKIAFREAVDREEKKTDNMYFYLTADIAYVQADEATGGYGTGYKLFCSAQDAGVNPPPNHAQETVLNLDGRGYTISATYSNTNGGDRWMFDRIIDSNIKNLSIKYDFELGLSVQATIANRISNSTFENCYFEVKLLTALVTHARHGIHYMCYSIDKTTFTGCVFNFINNSSDADKVGIYMQNEGEDQVFENCALAYKYQDGADSLFAGLVPLEGVEIRTYDSMAELLTAESAKTWPDVWTVSETSLKLAGKEVAAPEQAE